MEVLVGATTSQSTIDATSTCFCFPRIYYLVTMLTPNFSPFPELHTDRLLLRKWTLEDAPGLLQLRSDPDVMRYINRPVLSSVEQATAWINMILDSLEKTEGISWCMSLKDSPQEHIGNIGLWRIDKENYRAEVGYMLSPAWQGKGIMYEALVAIIDYGFEQMGLHSIEAQLDPLNLASAALLRKAGFVQEGYYRENCLMNGVFTDTAVYSLLASDKRVS